MCACMHACVSVWVEKSLADHADEFGPTIGSEKNPSLTVHISTVFRYCPFMHTYIHRHTHSKEANIMFFLMWIHLNTLFPPVVAYHPHTQKLCFSQIIFRKDMFENGCFAQ